MSVHATSDTTIFLQLCISGATTNEISLVVPTSKAREERNNAFMSGAGELAALYAESNTTAAMCWRCPLTAPAKCLSECGALDGFLTQMSSKEDAGLDSRLV